MEKSASSQADPLIQNLAKPFSQTIYRFIVSFSYRFISYFGLFITLTFSIWKLVNYQILHLKKSLVRLLVHRGSYFKHSPRLGLTAVMSTTTFSLIIMPAIQPLTNTLPTRNIVVPSDQTENIMMVNNPIVNTEKTSRTLRMEVTTHTIQIGDTLSSIAETYLVSTEGLKYVNNLTSDFIKPGEQLTIPPVGGLIHTVKNGDSLAALSDLYQVPAQAIADFNSLEDPFTLHSGDELVIPDAQIPQPKPVAPVYVAINPQPAAGLILETNVNNLGTGGFIIPTQGVLSQYFWWGHPAIDLAGSCGTPIVASDSGTITFAGWWNGGGGNSIWVDHGNGYVTKYAHMSAFERTGGTVNRGDVIGYVGTTGRSTGCHLHFEVHNGNTSVDPLTVL